MPPSTGTAAGLQGAVKCNADCASHRHFMPGISQRRFHSTIQAPAAGALEILAPHSEEILKTWQIHLQELGLSMEAVIPEGIHFAEFAENLRAATYPAFRQSIQAFGEKLVQRCRLD